MHVEWGSSHCGRKGEEEAGGCNGKLGGYNIIEKFLNIQRKGASIEVTGQSKLEIHKIKGIIYFNK